MRVGGLWGFTPPGAVISRQRWSRVLGGTIKVFGETASAPRGTPLKVTRGSSVRVER